MTGMTKMGIHSVVVISLEILMEYILIIGISLYIGYQIGQHVMAWRLRDIVVDYAKRAGFKIDENYNMEVPSKPQVSKLYIEEEKNVLYLYDHDLQEFICQAGTMEELAKLALEYKQIKYAAVLYGDHTFMFVDGTVKQHL